MNASGTWAFSGLAAAVLFMTGSPAGGQSGAGNPPGTELQIEIEEQLKGAELEAAFPESSCRKIRSVADGLLQELAASGSKFPRQIVEGWKARIRRLREICPSDDALGLVGDQQTAGDLGFDPRIGVRPSDPAIHFTNLDFENFINDELAAAEYRCGPDPQGNILQLLGWIIERRGRVSARTIRFWLKRIEALEAEDCPEQTTQPVGSTPLLPARLRGQITLEDFHLSIVTEVRQHLSELERRGCGPYAATELALLRAYVKSAGRFVSPQLRAEWQKRIDALEKRDCPQPKAVPQASQDGKQVSQAVPLSPANQRILDLHNAQRTVVGLPALRWDPALQAAASAWAVRLARTGQLAHAPRAGRGITRENLSQGMLGWTPEQMMRTWLQEQTNFFPGVYPNVSRTGRWQDVSHYTQMIWPTTTYIGCGMAMGSGFQWLVCRYSPGGNKDGHTVGQMTVNKGG